MTESAEIFVTTGVPLTTLADVIPCSLCLRLVYSRVLPEERDCVWVGIMAVRV